MTTTPTIYANAGSVVLSHQDCVLKLALMVDDDVRPVVNIVLSLQYAVGLHDALGQVRQALTGEHTHEPPVHEPATIDPALETWRQALADRYRKLEDLTDWLIQQRKARVSLPRLAYQLQTTPATLYRFLESHAPEFTSLNRGSRCDAHADTIYADRRAGKTIKATGLALKIPYDTLYAWLRKHPEPQESQG
jgi:hypothetical protein